jgi:hypothetical protein
MFACICAVFGLASASAHAVTPAAPPDGSVVSATPTLTWELAAGERAGVIEISPDPTIGSGGQFEGQFVPHPQKRSDTLSTTQTAYTVRDFQRLTPGRWYWHVGALDANGQMNWTSVRAFDVPDLPPVTDEFKSNYSSCIKEIAIEFDWSDDTGDTVRWTVAFVRREAVVAIRSDSASAGASPFVPGSSVNERFHLPRSMKVGRAYRAYLAVTDSVGQSSPILSDRLKARRC